MRLLIIFSDPAVFDSAIHSLTIHPLARYSTKKTRAKNLHNINNVIKALFVTSP